METSQLPVCPACQSEYSWLDGEMLNCPECGNVWSNTGEQNDETELRVRDANGNTLSDGDNVTVIKDLKVKGSSTMLKIGNRVKNNRLVEGDHKIECKI